MNSSEIEWRQWPLLLAFALGLALPVSTALTNILFPVCGLVAFLLYKNELFKLIKQQPVAWIGLILLVLLAIGAMRTGAVGLEYLSKYKKMLFLPLIAIFLAASSLHTKRLIYGFVTGNALILIASCVIWCLGSANPMNNNLVGLELNHRLLLAAGVTKNPIAQSLLMSFGCAFCVALARIHGKKWLYVLAMLMVVNIFLMSPQRTGYLAIFLMGAWAGWLWLGWKTRLWGGVVVLFVITALGLGQSTAIKRIERGFTEAGACIAVLDMPQQDIACNTSIGLRTYWYSTALTRIAERPILGYGTGNFSIPTLGGVSFSNAHNEYLMQGMQLGLVGIILYLSLLIAGIRAALRLADPWKTILSGILAAYAVCSLFNSLLLDFTEGYTLVTVLAVVLALAIHTANSSNSSESKASHV